MALSADDKAMLMAAVDAYNENRRTRYRSLLMQLAPRERNVLVYVWGQLGTGSLRREGGLVQVALDIVSEESGDILRRLWREADPPRLHALANITRDLVPPEYCWVNAKRSVHREPVSGREHVNSLSLILRRWRSRRKRKALLEEFLVELDERLIGPALARMFMDMPSKFVSAWTLRHIRQILADGVCDPSDLEWNGLPATIASVLLAGGVEWESVLGLLQSESDRERRIGVYVLAGDLKLKSDCLYDWIASRYKRIKGAPSRAERQALLIASNLLVECKIRGLG